MQTVGPQCAGKTTYLKTILPEGVEDIATDDVPQVYERVPVGAFLDRLGFPNEKFTCSTTYTDRKTHGLSVFCRIDQIALEEQGLLALLFTGTRTFLEIEQSLTKCLPEGSIRNQFIDVVKEVAAQNLSMVSNMITYLIKLNLFTKASSIFYNK